MYRVQPVQNKVLEKKWNLLQQEMHNKKIRDVKTSIDSKVIKLRRYQRNTKKDAIMESRYTEIERENRILLEKMASIMHNRNPNSAQTLSPPKRSLNNDKRKQNLLKITIENQSILRRLQDKASFYKVSDWETDFKKRERILRKMCEYPYILEQKRNQTFYGDPNQTQDNSAFLADPFQTLGVSNNLPRINNKSVADITSSKNSANITNYGAWNKLTKSDIVVKQANILDENRIVLYKRGKQIANGYYIVEISSNNTHLYIAAYDVETPESLLIELPEKKAQELLLQFKNDYDYMASSLNITNKRLMLLNPKYIQSKRATTGLNTYGGTENFYGGGEISEQYRNKNDNRSLTAMNFTKQEKQHYASVGRPMTQALPQNSKGLYGINQSNITLTQQQQDVLSNYNLKNEVLSQNNAADGGGGSEAANSYANQIQSKIAVANTINQSKNTFQQQQDNPAFIEDFGEGINVNIEVDHTSIAINENK